jgi:hypothetical protein
VLQRALDLAEPDQVLFSSPGHLSPGLADRHARHHTADAALISETVDLLTRMDRPAHRLASRRTTARSLPTARPGCCITRRPTCPRGRSPASCTCRHASYAAGQAGAVAYVAAHELGGASYAIEAARAAAPQGESEPAGRLECRWQRDQLPEAIRELVLDDQRLRNDICWSVSDCCGQFGLLVVVRDSYPGRVRLDGCPGLRDRV